MTRRFFGFCGVLTSLALVSGSCVEDPLADLDGTPEALIVSHNAMRINQGSGMLFTATVVDGRSTPLPIPVSVTPCSANISVAPADPAPVPPTQTQTVVTGVQLASTCFDVAGAGFTAHVPVVVVPTAFAGALSSTTPLGGDTMTIASTAVLKFDTNLVAVTFGGGAAGIMLAKTPDLLTVLVPFSPDGPLTIAGIDVTYVPGLRDTLPTSVPVAQTGDQWPGDQAYATAPIIPIPAAGTSYRMITAFGAANGPNCAEFGPAPPNGSTGPCVIYRFDVTAPTALRFSTDWNSTADVDIYSCDATGLPGCFESGGSGATGTAKPENLAAFTYPAGTHYFVVELWSGAPPTNLYLTVTRP